VTVLQDMTAKEAVEALMIKEPNGETLRFLRKEGLLNQILHPERSFDGAAERGGGYRYDSVDLRTGRKGGRSQRPIAVHSPAVAVSKPKMNGEADSSVTEHQNGLTTESSLDNDVGLRSDAETIASAASGATSSPPTGSTLEMSQFASFDEYLAALVSSRKAASSDGTGRAERSQPHGRTNAGSATGNNSGGNVQGGDMTLGLAAQTVPVLKELCRNRGLPVSGSKAQLIARLSA
jgi:hypothetical protein